MQYRSLFAAALCAVNVLAAPSLPSLPPAGELVVENYFKQVAAKIADLKKNPVVPTCDLNNAVLPVASPTPLPPVSAGLTLKHVAIGRGTQNYSCDVTNSTALPVALGAVATLYNASCIASAYPDLLVSLPNLALQFNLSTPTQSPLTPANLAISGHHFFSNNTTPDFAMDFGFVPCAKNNSVPAPAGASIGQNGVGIGAVTWLKLVARDGATEGLSEVYRINTAGGAAPPTCAGMAAKFEVQYAAEYWFYASST